MSAPFQCIYLYSILLLVILQLLNVMETRLVEWKENLKTLHSQYDSLLFLSVQKVLRIHTAMKNAQNNVSELLSEVSYLFPNVSQSQEMLRNIVTVSLLNC